eukprot:scaffold40254_cov200-Skeletonema_dohrnii-CCMP3373.AAC.2
MTRKMQPSGGMPLIYISCPKKPPKHEYSLSACSVLALATILKTGAGSPCHKKNQPCKSSTFKRPRRPSLCLHLNS